MIFLKIFRKQKTIETMMISNLKTYIRIVYITVRNYATIVTCLLLRTIPDFIIFEFWEKNINLLAFKRNYDLIYI